MPANSRAEKTLRLGSHNDMATGVVKLPGKISAYKFISRGAIGCVYQINDRIALNYTRGPDAEEIF